LTASAARGGCRIRSGTTGTDGVQAFLPAEPRPASFVSEASRQKEAAMNRNVTISLGALIVIIIIVALVF
jgi:hypothetical protein